MSLFSNSAVDPVAEAEKLYVAAAETAGPRLTELAQRLGVTYIKERDHLQPVFRQALKDTVKDERPRPSVSFDLNHGLEQRWPSLGMFDDHTCTRVATILRCRLPSGDGLRGVASVGELVRVLLQLLSRKLKDEPA